MPTKIVTKSTTEPISVADAKTFCQVSHDADDLLIKDLVSFARQVMENRTGKTYLTATYELHVDGFNAAMTGSNTLPMANLLTPVVPIVIRLPFVPVTAVSSITYKDINEAVQTLAPSSYLVDLVGGRVQVLTVPSTSQNIDAVTVTFTAGATAPYDIRQAMRWLVKYAFESRSAEPMKVMSDAVDNIVMMNRDISIA